ncbi:hypothetical protein DPMN_122863 [Dreissena polymorpha]|uniref:Uncharacterized protein n=1 Tax=Dreissena polymorpha TaxID=45954 RepID=A0A9D4JQR3_DREPO|nr:hypothetical protein DPMN_122863 [Dreissena polymorpha]
MVDWTRDLKCGSQTTAFLKSAEVTLFHYTPPSHNISWPRHARQTRTNSMSCIRMAHPETTTQLKLTPNRSPRQQ